MIFSSGGGSNDLGNHRVVTSAGIGHAADGVRGLLAGGYVAPVNLGTIDFINGNKMFLSDSIYNHQPKEGDVILFPNYLMHCVYPFLNSNEERRSISFNVHIDNDIYNVHGSSLDEK